MAARSWPARRATCEKSARAHDQPREPVAIVPIPGMSTGTSSTIADARSREGQPAHQRDRHAQRRRNNTRPTAASTSLARRPSRASRRCRRSTPRCGQHHRSQAEADPGWRPPAVIEPEGRRRPAQPDTEAGPRLVEPSPVMAGFAAPSSAALPGRRGRDRRPMTWILLAQPTKSTSATRPHWSPTPQNPPPSHGVRRRDIEGRVARSKMPASASGDRMVAATM